jgi:hypothetical protein
MKEATMSDREAWMAVVQDGDDREDQETELVTLEDIHAEPRDDRADERAADHVARARWGSRVIAALFVVVSLLGLGGIPAWAIVGHLQRIADALEAQNRLHASWCESQETPFS